MSTKASTAALDPMSERLSLSQRRAPRHSASGHQEQQITELAPAAQSARMNLKRCVNLSVSARASVTA
jgi:hypothetical protein